MRAQQSRSEQHARPEMRLNGRFHWLWAGILLALLGSEWVLAKAAEKHPGMRAFAEQLAPEDRAAQERVLGLLNQAEYQASIIKAMTRPAEATKTWAQYRPIFMTDKRIEGGREFYAQHAELLARVSEQYGVPAEIIVAIIGVETFYGRITGSYRVLDALTTLAFYYPPRSPYFSGELKRFLGLPDERGVALELDKVKGSYAGAMGWGQFMPTSYATWAVDDDQDGTIDLWGSERDICASVANYLAEHGWRSGERVADPVALPAGADVDALLATGIEPRLDRHSLSAAGIELPQGIELATLVDLESPGKPTEYWLGYRNFYVLTRYNRSSFYAMSVLQLAQALREARISSRQVARGAP